MRHINNISFSDFLNILGNNGFSLLFISCKDSEQQRVLIEKRGFSWEVARREWVSPTGRHYIRFSIQVAEMPENVSWKGSRSTYTRRDGTPRSFPYHSGSQFYTLEDLIPFLSHSANKYRPR